MDDEEDYIQLLVESWINGNRTYVREKARKFDIKEVSYLVLKICKQDSYEQAEKFVKYL